PEPTKKPGGKLKGLFICLIVVLIAVFVFSVYQVVAYLVQSHQAKREEQVIQALIAQSETNADTAETAAPSPAPSREPAAGSPTPDVLSAMREPKAIQAVPAVLIQFTKALDINPDTVGQLKMGESIHTYVVQRDNSYYLRHSFTGEFSFSGAIFLDVTCSIYPQSRNLIIHGHNMQDGTALGKLLRYEKIDYLNKYPSIEFSTLYETARYVPFAVVYYSIDPDSVIYLDIYRINTMTAGEFDAFIRDVQKRSVYNIPVNVAKTDQILTVTTCATADTDIRFAVFSVKHDII
ncbi:MAG: class B sortase, partial [Bacillota bacterium]